MFVGDLQSWPQSMQQVYKNAYVKPFGYIASGWSIWYRIHFFFIQNDLVLEAHIMTSDLLEAYRNKMEYLNGYQLGDYSG